MFAKHRSNDERFDNIITSNSVDHYSWLIIDTERKLRYDLLFACYWDSAVTGSIAVDNSLPWSDFALQVCHFK